MSTCFTDHQSFWKIWFANFSELFPRNHIFSNHKIQACGLAKISRYSFIWTNVTMIYFMYNVCLVLLMRDKTYIRGMFNVLLH